MFRSFPTPLNGMELKGLKPQSQNGELLSFVSQNKGDTNKEKN
jgi:hypothetical protein